MHEYRTIYAKYDSYQERVDVIGVGFFTNEAEYIIGKNRAISELKVVIEHTQKALNQYRVMLQIYETYSTGRILDAVQRIENVKTALACVESAIEYRDHPEHGGTWHKEQFERGFATLYTALHIAQIEWNYEDLYIYTSLFGDTAFDMLETELRLSDET